MPANRQNPKMPKPRPHLAAAFMCERIIEDKEGVLSAIRIVDTFTVEPPPQGALSPNAQAVARFTMLLSFKAGDAEGKYKLQLRLQGPSGKPLKSKDDPSDASFPLVFEGPSHEGANVVVNFVLPIAEFGQYWFDVLVDDEVVTRVPFKVLRQHSDNSSMN
jgi:hypothetical protein